MSLNKADPTIASMFGLRDNAKNLREKWLAALGLKPGLLLGVEVEMEFDRNARVPDAASLLEAAVGISGTANFMDHHNEGSLTNGIELVLGPLPRQAHMFLLKRLFELDIPAPAMTTRASTHVHVDVRALTVSQLWNLCALYRITEPVLFEWVARDRESNPFCKPWYLDSADEFVARKYQALNLLPSGYALSKADGSLEIHNARSQIFGTVEFRHFPELNAARLPLFDQWLKMIEEMYKSSLDLDVQEMTHMAVKLNSNSENVIFLSRYFPKTAETWLTDLGTERIVRAMSPVITQFKTKLLPTHAAFSGDKERVAELVEKLASKEKRPAKKPAAVPLPDVPPLTLRPPVRPVQGDHWADRDALVMGDPLDMDIRAAHMAPIGTREQELERLQARRDELIQQQAMLNMPGIQFFRAQPPQVVDALDDRLEWHDLEHERNQF